MPRRLVSGGRSWGTSPWSSSGWSGRPSTTLPSSPTRATSPTGGGPPTWSRPGPSSSTPGLRAAGLGAVDEDDDGITITQEWVEDASNSGLFCAHAMGRFAGAHLAAAPWLSRNQLRDRMARVERYGGWQTLARTTVADVADHLWHRRAELLAAADALVQVPQHGDAVPANLLGRDARRRGRDRLVDARHRAGRVRPRLLRSQCARGAGAADRRLPAGDARRAGDTGRGHPGCAGDGGLHGAQPRRVGAGPRRSR